MADYATNIERLASGKINEIFYNSCEAHALIVLKNLIRNAESYVKSLCGNMCSEISNDEEYLNIVENFLRNNPQGKFSILFDSYEEGFLEKPIAKLLSKFSSQVEIRQLKSGRIMYQGSPIHFSVSDDRAFRIETDIEKKMAWGNYNDIGKANVFSSVFDKFFEDKYSDTIILKPIPISCI
jgi:hypothetical protein